MTFDTAATKRAARILIGQDLGPGDRLDALLLLAGQEFLWRRDSPSADFAEAVRRYEVAARCVLWRSMALPSFGVVRWRAAECCHEVGVRLAGRFLGCLSSPCPRPGCPRLACQQPTSPSLDNAAS